MNMLKLESRRSPLGKPGHKIMSRNILAAAIGVIVSSSHVAHAQSVGFTLEEVVVTAQKRSENLQDVPIAITAFTNEAMKIKGMTNIAQLGDFTPNVEIDVTSSFSGSTQVLTAYIRGIGQNDFAFNLDPGVGVYVDGVYYARTIGAVLDLLDLERVEVLKGPQGTLFGRNTIGGAINVITRRPEEEFGFQGEVTVGEYNRMDVRGAIDIPLIEDVLLSQISFSSKNRDGYHDYKNWTQDGIFRSATDSLVRPQDTRYDEAGGENTDNVRAKLEWRASDTAQVTFQGDFTNVDEQTTPSQLLSVLPNDGGALFELYNGCISAPPGVVAPPCDTPTANEGAILAAVNIDDDPFNDRPIFDNRYVVDGAKDFSYSTGAGYSKAETWGLATTIDWEMSEAIYLKSITSYRNLDSAFGMDVEGTPVAMGNHAFTMNQKQWSQEFQLNGIAFDEKMDWVLGGYFFHEEGDLTDFVHFAEGLLQILGPNEFDTDAYAVFTHINYALTERIGLTGGIRFTQEEKEFTGGQRDLNGLAAQLGFPLVLHPDPTDTTLYFPTEKNDASFNNTSIHLGAEYTFDEAGMIYASFSQGYKSGGWTTRATVPILEAPAFDEETADTYELGYKGQFLEDTLQTNIALFFTDYQDLQVTVQDGVSPVTENAADSEIKGFEAELTAILSDSFSVNATVGYIDAEYTDLEPGATLQEDFLFVNTPEWSWSLSADYYLSLNSGASMLFHADYAYKDEMANEGENQPLLISDEAHLFNAVAAYTSDDEKWKVSLGVRNLTDERYLVAGQNQPGIGYVAGTYNRPREWYLTMGFNY